MSTHESKKLVCFVNSTALSKLNDFFKVTGGYVQCKSGNISETVKKRDVLTRDHYNKMVIFMK